MCPSIGVKADPSIHPVIGVDIGGTKCAVSCLASDRVSETLRIPTKEFAETFEVLVKEIRLVLGGRVPDIGISCGGPLDPINGVILSPPNLPESWHGARICSLLTERLGGRACLMNDANACALAEWKFGAGRGATHMIFLTSGTGMGAGLILNGKLYEGATGDAGEIGHVRLGGDGPVGYGKQASVEGYCSGGGIARLAGLRFAGTGHARPAWASLGITAQLIAVEARAGDVFARSVFAESGARLGEAIAILIDLFNPERIVIGGFFPRCRDLLEPTMYQAIVREALPQPAAVAKVVSAELGESIGSYGAIAAALHSFGLTAPIIGEPSRSLCAP